MGCEREASERHTLEATVEAAHPRVITPQWHASRLERGVEQARVRSHFREQAGSWRATEDRHVDALLGAGSEDGRARGMRLLQRAPCRTASTLQTRYPGTGIGITDYWYIVPVLIIVVPT